uniref:Long-chain fatty acid--CoA ligase n=1 Tax=Heterorhabditis bacteriophora TaxID=37862 RepID=A0A1I7XF73_HETBA
MSAVFNFARKKILVTGASQVLSPYQPFHCLVNNAGIAILEEFGKITESTITKDRSLIYLPNVHYVHYGIILFIKESLNKIILPLMSVKNWSDPQKVSAMLDHMCIKRFAGLSVAYLDLVK